MATDHVSIRPHGGSGRQPKANVDGLRVTSQSALMAGAAVSTPLRPMGDLLRVSIRPYGGSDRQLEISAFDSVPESQSALMAGTAVSSTYGAVAARVKSQSALMAGTAVSL